MRSSRTSTNDAGLTGGARPVGTVASLSARVVAGCTVVRPDHPPLNPVERRWLEYQAAGATMQALWREAGARTVAATRAGIAAWDREQYHGAGLCDWWAVHPEGRLCFLALACDGALGWPAPRPGKAVRCAAHAAQLAARREDLLAICRGPCLTWSEDEGWHVVDAVAPASADVRRGRLLGVTRPRPWFWLYWVQDGRFVVRLEAQVLQIVADTPRAAIAVLRRCVGMYVGNAHAGVPPERLAVPENEPRLVETALTRDYLHWIEAVKREKGFWRDARLLTEAARTYVMARSTETGRERPDDGCRFTCVSGFQVNLPFF